MGEGEGRGRPGDDAPNASDQTDRTQKLEASDGFLMHRGNSLEIPILQKWRSRTDTLNKFLHDRWISSKRSFFCVKRSVEAEPWTL